jgi:hypothetical protein
MLAGVTDRDTAAGSVRPTRRRLLQAGLGLVALVVAGGGGLIALRGRPPRVQGLRVLDDQEFRTLSAVARVHLPPGGPFQQGADEVGVARAFDRYLADEPPEVKRDVKRALSLLEYGPLLFEGRLSTFSNLPPAEQLVHWRRWIDSDSLLRRQISWSLKKFLSLVFYDTPAVWPAIHYPGPSFKQAAP